ncbi:hypothetical protein L1049_024047 [Liquidambar formosana]|uniref:Ankyrin repeat domain-containing protein, chloroplastic n=1 Tax=Liquidambar formosana TaxID=63359 RepID=A0AAP0S033_LIQFO
MSSPTVLNPQTPKIFSLLPTSPFYLSTPRKLASIQTQTLTFPRKFCSISPPSLSSSFHSFPQQEVEDEEEEEEHVVGDCVVFEEGAFEDSYFQNDFNHNTNQRKTKKSVAAIEPQNLVPDKWREVQEEINITKKERRKIAQQLEFGRRVQKKKQGLVPLGNTSVEDYLAYRSEKLAQLKPLVLDNPSFKLKEEKYEAKGGGESKHGEMDGSSSSRVAPRNPRRAVYGGTLEDISQFFHSGSYEPGHSAAKEGPPRKLFTKEEKVLLNRRIPDLATATSSKWLPLHALAASGEFYLVDAILKHNVDINAADKDGLTALHKAIVCKKQAITNYFLRESANPFVRDKEGATLMHYAVRTASSHTIKILLLYNVDINAQDNDGWTPLHLAVQARRTDLLRLLLIKGADKTLKNRDGFTPLDLCLYSGQETRTYELIKLLKQLPKSR